MKQSVKRLLLAGALVAGPALINNAIFSRAKALGNSLGGEGRFWPWREGDVFYTQTGSGGDPILLVHGIYAGASIFEWRKNFNALGETHEVTALDLLGFGLSDKPKIRYSDTLYIDLLQDFIKEVMRKPCTLVASSLAGAYAIEAAAALPDLISRLVLVCPTGFNKLTTVEIDAAQQVKFASLTAPLLGTSLYNAITARASMRAYLQSQVYFDPSYVTDEMIDHYSTATHQYGSQYAPLSFIAGELGHTVTESFPKLTQPTIQLIWGREAKMTPLSEAEPFLSANANAVLTVIDKAGLLPHDEQADAFNRLLIEIMSEGAESGDAKPKRKAHAKKTDGATP